jgi:hypothetical protein
MDGWTIAFLLFAGVLVGSFVRELIRALREPRGDHHRTPWSLVLMGSCLGLFIIGLALISLLPRPPWPTWDRRTKALGELAGILGVVGGVGFVLTWAFITRWTRRFWVTLGVALGLFAVIAVAIILGY